ncbi:hypothetical protein Sgou_25930 [Streptomyces gougerotii]|uniref:Uncharacterized protein n=1 Tax=Streptomyces gougerotii TaxID=53448 RepID=A0A8H9HRC8_9ACTN|nr:hypothetical protein Sgou_25930 [Streptomyces gougerotii]GGU81379.1 hypothetical protein GCM10010227_39470 [Streptomyces gougerotii]
MVETSKLSAGSRGPRLPRPRGPSSLSGSGSQWPPRPSPAIPPQAPQRLPRPDPAGLTKPARRPGDGAIGVGRPAGGGTTAPQPKTLLVRGASRAAPGRRLRPQLRRAGGAPRVTGEGGKGGAQRLRPAGLHAPPGPGSTP